MNYIDAIARRIWEEDGGTDEIPDDEHGSEGGAAVRVGQRVRVKSDPVGITLKSRLGVVIDRDWYWDGYWLVGLDVPGCQEWTDRQGLRHVDSVPTIRWHEDNLEIIS